MLACRPFRKFWKAAKFFGGVNKTKPHYYRRYNGSIFVLFTTPKHLEDFQNFLNGRYANISFTIYRCFPIRLSWTKLHSELFFLKKNSLKMAILRMVLLTIIWDRYSRMEDNL